MFKNVASQKIQLFAFDTTTGAPKTGDAANITAYVSKDHGAVTVLGDTSATEMDATNAKGVYVFDLTQAETNADELTFTAKSSTANISITPRFISTVPPKFTTLVIDSAGLVDANAVKVGPSGSGTAQTARDLGASVLISSGTGTGQLDVTSGVIKSNLSQILGTALTETAGQIAAGFKKFFNIATPASTMDSLTLVATATSVTNGVTVSTNNDKTGYALTSAYDAAKTASQAGDAMTLTSGERTNIAAAIWNALTSGLTTVGSIGKLLVDNLDAAVSTRATPSDVPTAADNAGAVWDEDLSGHATSGSAGAALGAAGSAGDPWATALPGAYGAGTAGYIVGTNLDAAVSSVGGGSLTVQDIVDGILDEATASHQTAGTVGKAITDAQSAGDPMQGTAETGFTYGDLIRLLAAYAMGKTTVLKTGNKTATVTFRAVDDSADRIVGNVVGSERTSVTLTP
jgi:hypothetical protein